MISSGLQLQANMDAADDEHTLIFLNFAYGFTPQPSFRSINLTRFQRASEGSSESTSGGRDDVVERRRMRIEFVRRNLVVLRDCAVNPEEYWLGFSGKPSAAQGTLDPFDTNFGSVSDIWHCASLS